MIELKNDQLLFSFPTITAELNQLVEDYIARVLPMILAEDRALSPEDYPYATRPRVAAQFSDENISRVFSEAVRGLAGSGGSMPEQLRIDFQRTLRIPDDGRDYPLPPGLGRFPLRHIDDFGDRAPTSWIERGGVMMPLYQSEALWLYFQGRYPFAVKVGAGKINAVTGEPWRSGMSRAPQDYVVVPEQPWLDGFAVEKGVIRQFVAMPLGAGYSVEEQFSGKAEFGGLQLQVYPLKTRVYFEQTVLPGLPKTFADILSILFPPQSCFCMACPTAGMGLGAGGRMKQEIYQDPHQLDEWDLEASSRCFVHLCDALIWREITGANPPHTPVTAREYERANLPWYDFYRDDVAVLEGSKTLAGVKSVATLAKEKGDMALVGNVSVETRKVVHCGPKQRPEQVREWQEA